MEAAGAVSVSVFSKTIKVNASSARPSMQIAGLHCIVTFNWVKDYQMISNGTSIKQAGRQGCISCGTCSYLELTKDHVLTSAYVKIFRIVTRNAVNKSF